MALRPVLLMFHGLALLLGCGCQPLAHGLEDFSALFQRPKAASTSGQDMQNEAVIKANWPDLDSLWDEVEDSMKGITETVGEVTDGTVAKVDELGQQMQHFEEGLAQKIANALNHALEFVKKAADRLLSDTVMEKTAFYDELTRALAVSNETLLPEFEKAADKVLTSTWGRWQNMRVLVDSMAKKIEQGLRSAGQGALAQKFGQMMDSAVASLDSFMERLKTCDQDLHGIGQKSLNEAQAALLKVNDELNEALQHVAAFLAKFQQTFQDISEQISNSLILSTEEVDRAFATVQHNVTSISWRVRSSGRELVLGVHRGMVTVAKAKNMTVPEWHPVSTAPADPAAAAPGAAPASDDKVHPSASMGLHASLLAFVFVSLAMLLS